VPERLFVLQSVIQLPLLRFELVRRDVPVPRLPGSLKAMIRFRLHCRARLLAGIGALFAFCALASGAQPQSPAKPLPALTRASQVRQLSVEQAALGYPVRVRGVITGDVPAPDFFVQDSTAGIYVEGSQSPTFAHHLGDLVEVEGITGPGKFAPVIREQKLRLLGKGVLPKTRIYSFSELADGQFDSQWVKIRGTVRSASIDRTSWRETTLALRVDSGGGQFNVRVPIKEEEEDFSSWIGSEVLMEGVCGSRFTSQRQLAGVLLYVSRLSLIKVQEPAPEVSFSALLRFSPSEGNKHRVRVRGVVAYQQLGKALFVQNQEQGLRVLTQQETALETGDVVEVLGFPALGESAPVLEDAVFHRVGHETLREPVNLDLSLPWERYDGTLVTTDAQLLDRQQQPEGLRLLLRTSETLFDATLPPGGPAGRLMAIPINSQVRVAGICLVRSGGLWAVPQSFRMLLRSAEDVAVLRAPSWWNLRHTLWLLGITVGALIVVVVSVVVVGRRVREQMAAMRQKLRSGAVLEERNRIARELHDTLEQELAGITMQLDLAADCFQQAPRVAQEAVETARNMSRHSMVGARRSVWDLRCHWLENGDLVWALRQAVQSLARDQVQVEVKVQGEPVRLAPAVEMNLLRIGQEAATNAFRHGHARQISLELRYDPQCVRLSVRDDGKGFSPDEAAVASDGHFGLLDMRERAQAMGGSLHVDSTPGRGTQVSVEVARGTEPFSNEERKTHSYSRG